MSFILKVKDSYEIYKKTKDYLNRIIKVVDPMILDECGKMGVESLKAATPVRTGKTANSWYYKVVSDKKGSKLIFYNTNYDQDADVSVAILIQYGHGTGSGVWIEGVDYINPALRPIFDNVTERIWKEVTY